MTVLGSLGYGVANLMHPRMLWLMLWPMLVAVGLWGLAAFFLWVRTALWIADLLRSVVPFNPGDWLLVAAHVLLFLLFVPLVYLTALFILGIFGMQQMVDHVARRSYPQLERRHGGGVAGSVWNGVVALLGMLGLGIVTLPLWLFPPLWPVIAVAILGWVNQRLLRYDALAEHASADEMRRIFRERRGALYLLGLLLALAAYVPFLGFLAPVIFGLALIHYLLGALESGYRRHGDKSLEAGNAAR